MLKGLLQRRLLFVTGKGGVGKTTMVAALGLLATRQGKRVLLCELDTDPSLRRIFSVPAIGFETARLAENLYACNLVAADCMRAFVGRVVPSRRVADAIVGNRIVGIFFESAPSVMEAVILDQIAERVTQEKPGYDLVIIDLPASGHAIKLLRVARSMAEMVSIGELAKRLHEVDALFTDPARAGLVLVTLPEEMPVNETLELAANLKSAVKTAIVGVVCNGLRHLKVEAADTEAASAALGNASAAGAPELLEALELARYWTEQEREQIARLRTELSIPLFDTPFVFSKASDRDLVEQVAGRLMEQA
jgi:anion-transporting  ArsA/GET3 family ATPase